MCVMNTNGGGEKRAGGHRAGQEWSLTWQAQVDFKYMDMCNTM